MSDAIIQVGGETITVEMTGAQGPPGPDTADALALLADEAAAGTIGVTGGGTIQSEIDARGRLLSSFGALGDARMVDDAAIDSGDATLTSATAAFTVDDVGKTIAIAGAGPAGATLVTTILLWTNGTTVELAVNASTTVEGDDPDIKIGAAIGTPAQAALDDALAWFAAAGGGTLIVDGPYLLTGGSSQDFLNLASNIRIIGTGSTSIFYIACDSATSAITLANIPQLHIGSGLNFVGLPGATTDAKRVLDLGSCYGTIDARFWGLMSSVADGAVIFETGCSLVYDGARFSGCAGNSANSTPVIHAYNWANFKFRDGGFVDYGDFNGIHHTKIALGNPYGWVRLGQVGDGGGDGGDVPVGIASFSDVHMDEGAQWGIIAQPVSGRIPKLVIDRLKSNVAEADDFRAVKAFDTDVVVIRDCVAGLSTDPGTVAGDFNGCGLVQIERWRLNESVDTILAEDCDTLRIIDSPDITTVTRTNVTNYYRTEAGWTTWTPTIAPSAGTFGAPATLNDTKYRLVEDMCHIELDFTIPANGTGATQIGATMPFQPQSRSVIPGTEFANTGIALRGALTPGSSEMTIRYGDASYPGGDGNRLVLSGSYRIAT